ncbi:MAG: Hpt domain-containing protein [Treponema sp.]|nr:Hpt domain-containing protein [Treponema sp.]
MNAPQADDFISEADREFKIALQKSFIKNSCGRYNEIINAIKSGDIELAHRLAHTMKGNAAQLNEKKLREAAAIVENELKDEKNAVTEKHLKDLETEFTSVLNKYKQLQDDKETQTYSETDALEPEKANELLEKIASLLNAGDPECINHTESIKRIPRNSELKKQLIQQMDDFNFASALVTLNKLKI